VQKQSRSSSSRRSLVTSVMAPSMPVTSGQRRAAANLITRSGSPTRGELLQSGLRLGLLAALCRSVRAVGVGGRGLLGPLRMVACGSGGTLRI
jgi:hypothetical protein